MNTSRFYHMVQDFFKIDPDCNKQKPFIGKKEIPVQGPCGYALSRTYLYFL